MLKNLVAFASLSISTVGTAAPLQWQNVPTPNFSSPYNFSQPNPYLRQNYGGPSYVTTPEGRSTVQQMNEKTFMVRDAQGNTHFCIALSENQVRCN